jgi:hypothetical protein
VKEQAVRSAVSPACAEADFPMMAITSCDGTPVDIHEGLGVTEISGVTDRQIQRDRRCGVPILGHFEAAVEFEVAARIPPGRVRLDLR